MAGGEQEKNACYDLLLQVFGLHKVPLVAIDDKLVLIVLCHSTHTLSRVEFAGGSRLLESTTLVMHGNQIQLLQAKEDGRAG